MCAYKSDDNAGVDEYDSVCDNDEGWALDFTATELLTALLAAGEVIARL
jgi:hypothetical protein